MLALWSTAKYEYEDSTLPSRTLERFTVGPQVHVQLEACLSGHSYND